MNVMIIPLNALWIAINSEYFFLLQKLINNPKHKENSQPKLTKNSYLYAMQNGVSYTYQQHLPFGARYLDSDLSVWLSVDPMSDERPWLSPYNYVQWNPIGRALDDEWDVCIKKDGSVDFTWKSNRGGNRYDVYLERL